MNLKMNITPKMLPFITKKKRFKVAIGGRGGTKSQTCIDGLIMLAHTKREKVCCFREFGASIEDSVWSLISDEIERMEVPGFSIGQRKIEHKDGGCFKSKGLGRDSKSIKSFSGFDKFLIEEGDFLTDEILRDLTPTLRKEDSELWVIFNPQSREDTVSRRFLLPYYDELLSNGVYEDDMHYIVWTNYDENPWFPEVLEQERQLDLKHIELGIITQDEYNHKWLGHFNDTVPQAIIRQEWFDAAIDAHLKLNFKPIGIEVVSHDPSDLGVDDKALCYRHGSVVLDCKTKQDGDFNDGCDWALNYAIEKQADLFVWDAIGVSLHKQVKDALKGKRIDYKMYKGSESVDWPDEVYEGEIADKTKRKTHKQTWKNNRAQKAGLLADRFKATYLAVTKGIYTDPDKMISISSKVTELEELRAETCRIPQKPNGNGLFQLYTKDEMKTKFKIKSPNRFDAFYMAFETAEKKAEDFTMEFDGWAV